MPPADCDLTTAVNQKFIDITNVVPVGGGISHTFRVNLQAFTTVR